MIVPDRIDRCRGCQLSELRAGLPAVVAIVLHLRTLGRVTVDVVAQEQQDVGLRVVDGIPHALMLGGVAGTAAEGKPQGEPAAGRLDGSEGSGGFRFCAVETEPVVVARALLQAGNLQDGGEVAASL